MRAFSLMELMVGLLLGMMLISGFIGFSHRMSSAFLRWKRQQQAHGQLLVSANRIHTHMAMEESAFWEAFPLAKALVHAADHTHGGQQFSHSCPDASVGGCMVSWDLHPKTAAPTDYLITDREWPVRIKVRPVDDTLPIGPDDSVTPGTLVLLVSSDLAQPALVSDTAGDWVYLAPDSDQPWDLPESLAGEGIHAVILGDLTLTHMSLTASPGRHSTLRFQPWQWKDDGWRRGRSQTGDTYLTHLHYRPCNQDAPDRLTLVAQPKNPVDLPIPITVADTTYHQEVFFETLAFK